MRDFLRQDSLDAVRRGRLELHLRRCDMCRAAAEGLTVISSARPKMQPIEDIHSRRIYDRLIPAVHEIAVDLASARKKPARVVTPIFGLYAAAAAVAAVVLVVGLLPDSQEVTDPSAVQADQTILEITHNATMDRCEGTAIVDGRKVGGVDSSFAVRLGTEIAVNDGGRFNFRIGHVARVALVGDTRWRISNITEDLMEMELDMGRIAVEFDGSGGQMLDIRTPDSIVRVRGTIFMVEVVPNGGTQVSVFEGRVDVVSLLGTNRTVELTGGKLVSIPFSKEGVVDIGDGQRALAGEIIDLEDSFVATAGRLVHFDGSPRRVKVEVEGRLLGYSPLTVRLPDGPVQYRLSSPGMEPLESRLAHEQVGENVSFELAPATNYQPVVTADGDQNESGKKSKRSALNRATPHKRWGLIERAHAAMTAGDIPFAIGLLERATVASTGDRLVNGLSLLAECYSSVGRFKAAADTFDRVSGLVMGTKIAQNSHYEVGRLSMDRLGDFGRARAAFTAYLASPLEGDLKEAAYFSLCELDGREGSHREALHCFNNFLRTFPGGYHEPNARLWRGALYQDVLKRWADAERDLMAFIQAKPRHPRAEEARYRVALGRYHADDKRGSLRMIKEYLSEHPDGQYRVRALRLKRAIVDPDFSLQSNLK